MLGVSYREGPYQRLTFCDAVFNLPFHNRGSPRVTNVGMRLGHPGVTYSSLKVVPPKGIARRGLIYIVGLELTWGQSLADLASFK